MRELYHSWKGLKETSPQNDDQDIIEEEEMQEETQEVDADTDVLQTKIPERFNHIQVKQSLKIADFQIKTNLDFRTTLTLVFGTRVFEDVLIQDFKGAIQDDTTETIRANSADVKAKEETFSIKISIETYSRCKAKQLLRQSNIFTMVTNTKIMR